MQSWQQFIESEKKQDYLKQTFSYIENERRLGKTIYPPENTVFSAFDLTPFEQVKVVILGQDPYHGAGQAHGLAFSVKPGIKPPPSLANIYKELVIDIEGFEIPQHGYLQSWAEQGVLLLNTVLTVEQGQAHSHKHLGWEQFTDRVIEQLNLQGDKIIFLLWGAHAQKKGKNINTNKHFILNAPHPSPLSAHRGFFGSKPFSQTNQLLSSIGKKPIDWRLS